MAVCNIFRHLSKETGTFLTFSQYMEDLTIWKTEGKYHKIVPSKFIAIDCKQKNYNNLTLPKYIQEYFENACACFKNNPQTMVEDEIDSMAFGWDPEYTKTLFWNMMFESESNSIQRGLIDMEDIKYVGDINLQSYNTVDGMGYSEIYCHIPNDAAPYVYTKNTNQNQITHKIQRSIDQCVEGFKYGELDGWELLSLYEDYEYMLDKSYELVFHGLSKKKQQETLITTYCGLDCTGCEWREPCNCNGCVSSKGFPFHCKEKACPIASCAINRDIIFCGMCKDFPCQLLIDYSCDKDDGDTPSGARIEACRLIKSLLKK
jgi:hypothetical protein